MQKNRAAKRGPGQASRPAISTAKEVEALRREAKEYAVRDAKTEGLWLVVKPTGTKSWVLFYSFGGKQRKLTIGQKNLAEARDAVHDARVSIREKIDPAQAKRLLNEAERGVERRKTKPLPRAAAAVADGSADPAAPILPAAHDGPIDAFANVISLYVESYVKRRKRRWQESARMLRQLATLHAKRLSEITPDEFDAALKPLWKTAPVSTIRLHSEISSLCAWACGEKTRKTLKPGEQAFIEPPVELKALLKGKEPFAGVAKQVAEPEPRDRVLMKVDDTDDDDEANEDLAETFRDLRLVWQACDAMIDPYVAVVKMLILTGQRLSEVAKMDWSEVNLDARVWRLPGERTKNKKAHTVPLAPAAVALLRSLPRIARKPGEMDYVFGVKPPTGFTLAKKKLDREVARLNGGRQIEQWRFHDLRRTLVSGLAKLKVDLFVIERIVNHTSGTFSGIVGTYQKHEFGKERRAALNKWADLIETLAHEDHSRQSDVHNEVLVIA
jgi:integrase